MSSIDSRYQMNIQDFQSRFVNCIRIDDIFIRGYTLCLDSETEKKAILKFYSI